MRICSVAQGQLTPQSVAEAIRQNIELIQVVLFTCYNEKDQIKNEGARVLTRFSPLSPYGSYMLPWILREHHCVHDTFIVDQLRIYMLHNYHK